MTMINDRSMLTLNWVFDSCLLGLYRYNNQSCWKRNINPQEATLCTSPFIAKYGAIIIRYIMHHVGIERVSVEKACANSILQMSGFCHLLFA